MNNPVKIPLRVRFDECDPYNHVNDANYVKYINLGVLEFFRKIYSDIQNLDFMYYTVRVEMDYKDSALFDDSLEIVTDVEKMGNTSLIFNIDIIRKKDNQVIINAKMIIVFINNKTKLKIQVPEKIVSFVS